jgi:organic hydroperoxide reductase OsmC/OhrA
VSHHYRIHLKWTGNNGGGTSSYSSYSRNHFVQVEKKPELLLSSDPSFRGDPRRYNPEEMLLISLSSCHMLWYLHLCADAGIVVKDYEDHAEGKMELNADGSGKFTEVFLRPVVSIENQEHKKKALELHQLANKKCFIANSVNFPVKHLPEIV